MRLKKDRKAHPAFLLQVGKWDTIGQKVRIQEGGTWFLYAPFEV